MANPENNANTTYFDASGDEALLKTGRGRLGRLVIHTVGTAATVILYDALSATGNILYSWASADGKIDVELDARFATGLYLDISGTTPGGFVTWS